MSARVASHAVSRHRSNVVHAARLVGDRFSLACGGGDVPANAVERWHEHDAPTARRAITCRSCVSALDAGRCRWLDVDALVSPAARALVEQVAPLVEQRENARAARAGARAAMRVQRIYATGRREHETCERSTPGCSIDHTLDAGGCETW